jgi:hypothetical protein
MPTIYDNIDKHLEEGLNKTLVPVIFHDRFSSPKSFPQNIINKID